MVDPLWSETFWSTFKYFIILIVSTFYMLWISWIINCLSLMHGANMKIFTLFKTSRHARSKLCLEHCVAQAKADVELCCPALLLNSRWHIETCESQKPALLCTSWAALPTSQCAPGLSKMARIYLWRPPMFVNDQGGLWVMCECWGPSIFRAVTAICVELVRWSKLKISLRILTLHLSVHTLN